MVDERGGWRVERREVLEPAWVWFTWPRFRRSEQLTNLTFQLHDPLKYSPLTSQTLTFIDCACR
ncbi:hypothetical protein [Micromonospora sp. MW-13]|uniref:hypothetical protein n=1 Tax=Micromonospora sp. MW-13 TaxID=2094022 RepID=UPI000FFE7D63|nr:hypothetical protein [Micromonospora sp. MW-13]